MESKHIKEENLYIYKDNSTDSNLDSDGSYDNGDPLKITDFVDSDYMRGKRAGGPLSGRGNTQQASTNSSDSSNSSGSSSPLLSQATGGGQSDSNKDNWKCDVPCTKHGEFDPNKDDLFHPYWFGKEKHEGLRFCYYHAFEVGTCQYGIGHGEDRKYDPKKDRDVLEQLGFTKELLRIRNPNCLTTSATTTTVSESSTNST